MRRIRVMVLLAAVLAAGGAARGQDDGVAVQFDVFNAALVPQGTRWILVYPVCIRAVNSRGLTTIDRLPLPTGTNGSVTFSNLVWGDYRSEFLGAYQTTTNWFTVPNTNGVKLNVTNLIKDAFICPGSSVPAYSAWSLQAGTNVTLRKSGTVTYIDASGGSQAPTGALTNQTFYDSMRLRGVTDGIGPQLQMGYYVGLGYHGGALEYAADIGILGTPLAGFAFSSPVQAPLFAGSGTYLTSLDGRNVQAGTINSNSLDAATAAQLALAGTGGGSGTASNLAAGLSITNPTLVNPVISGTVTEGAWTSTTDSNTNTTYTSTSGAKVTLAANGDNSSTNSAGWRRGAGGDTQQSGTATAAAFVGDGSALSAVKATATNAISSLSLTNLKVFVTDGSGRVLNIGILFTNGGWMDGTNNLRMLFPYQTNGQVWIEFGGYPEANRGMIRWQTDHGTGLPELYVGSGGRLCLGWGDNCADKCLQLGYGGYKQYIYVIGENSGGRPWNTNALGSIPILLGCSYFRTNGTLGFAPAVANPDPNNPNPVAQPAIVAESQNSDGDSAIVLYDYFGYTLTGDQWDFAHSKQRVKFLSDTSGGLSGGMDLRGRMILEQSGGTIQLSLFALDFGKGAATHITNGVYMATFYATNTTGYTTNYERRVFFISSCANGLIIPSWPTGWNWLTAAPSSLPANNLLRLELESIGPGQSNIVASATTCTDNTGATFVSLQPPQTNLVMWFKSTANIYADGTQTNWPDSSGTGYNATNSANTKPFYALNAINGLPAYRFFGTNWLATTDSVNRTNQTIFAVYKASADNKTVFGRKPVAISLAPRTATTGIKFSYGNVGFDSGTSGFVTDWDCVCCMNGGGACRIFGSGTTSNYMSHAFFANGIGQWETDPTYIGANCDLTSGFVGDVAEILYYNTALSFADKDAAMTYLRAKYSLP